MTGLAEAIHGAIGQPATVRIGRVASINPVVITAQGVPFEDVGFLNGYRPMVGQSVALLGQCSDSGSDPASWLALGAVLDPPGGYQAAERLVSFASATSNTSAVVFPQPFAAAPNVHVNINTGAGGIALWQARAINITAAGFDLFVYTTGAAAVWTNVPVDWSAFPRTA